MSNVPPESFSLCGILATQRVQGNSPNRHLRLFSKSAPPITDNIKKTATVRHSVRVAEKIIKIKKMTQKKMLNWGGGVD